MNKRFLTIPLILAFSSTAFAAESDKITFSHFYGGIKLGTANYGDLGAAVTDVTGVDDSPFSWGAYFGIQALPWLAFELGYHDLGEADLKDVSGSYDAKTLDLTAKASYEFAEKFSVFGKVGFQAYEWNANGENVYEDDQGWTPHLGAGVEYQFHKNWSGAIEYTWYNDIGGPDINYYGVSATYHWF
ncbi:outer membrane beta-barrel protein [Vibrio neonatus]|uniref:outer membrane beta-barrel protein n=1 Tax=Vibrio neonatus TaxID=278860 RepID=UPI0021C4B8C9|nr:outer membrane beta-barrel protein [Vibrio neonatus]